MSVGVCIINRKKKVFEKISKDPIEDDYATDDIILHAASANFDVGDILRYR